MAIPRPGAPPPVSEINVEAAMAYAEAAHDLQRYEDLVSAMESVVKMTVGELTREQKMMVELGYRKVMEAKRQERWRLEWINAVHLIPEVEREMENICRNARAMVHDHLIPSSTSAEEIVRYHTMIGDFYRYRSEIKTTYWNYYASFAFIEYQWAENLALTELTGHNLVRLRLSYNFSTLCYQILPKPDRALAILIKALDAALLSASVHFLDEASFMIVKLLVARLYNWFPPNRVIYIGETPPTAYQKVAQVLQINNADGGEGFAVGIIR